MSNPLVKVVSALYGGPTTPAIDVTSRVQEIFDTQYTQDPAISTFSTPITCGPQNQDGGTLNIPDPDYGQHKSFTIRYILPEVDPNIQLYRGIQDSQTLVIVTSPTRNNITILNASYGHDRFTWDITDSLASYFKDPANPSSFSIDSSWWDLIGLYYDPDPGVVKSLSVTYVSNGVQKSQCAIDGQTITIA